MGMSCEYMCSKCGYTVMTSAGRDMGFVAVTRTMICNRCKKLVEVLIGRHGKDGPTGDLDYDKQLGLCPKCAGTDLRPWPKRHPCPKCDGKMGRKPGGDEIMWD